MQKVSAPVAVVILALVALVGFLAFSQYKPAPVDEPVYTRPFEPPVEADQLNDLRAGVAPLGITVIMPPLASDRFRGARVGTVRSKGPADEAGIEPGDLITSVDGYDVTQPFAVGGILSQSDPDQPCEIVVERAGEEYTFVVMGLHLPERSSS